VGPDGSTVVADSSTSTGLRYTANFAAGKNKIINGDFNVNQRAFTSTTTTATYGFDRWRYTYSGGTTTYSAETFTLGTAPVAGYESKNFARLVTTSQSAASDNALLGQRIESVRTLANQTATFSFWAKAASGTPKVNVNFSQYFGSGGSPSASVTNLGTAQTISTSWARYSFTVTLASISGKTLGTNNDDFLNAVIYVSDGGNVGTGVGAQNNTFDIWGVQVEAGSVATAFQTATGTLQGELAACQRYYWRSGGNTNSQVYGIGIATATTTASVWVQNPTTMRITPSSIDFSTLATTDFTAFTNSFSGLTMTFGSPYGCRLDITGGSGMTLKTPIALTSNNSSAAYLGLSAEL
jgi:hypothetical protein